MNIKNRLKRWFRLRFAILYPFVIFVAIFANCDDRSIAVSLWFIIIGLIIRVWANGYAIKMDKLTTSGPYAFVRNPLYLGTLFIAIGFVIMLKIFYLGLLFIGLLIITYYRTIKKEEKMLLDKFKDEYINYKKKVPAILPTFFSYRHGEKWSFSLKRFIESKEYKNLIWIIIVTIAFYIKAKISVEHEKMNSQILSLIILAFMLGMVDLVGELIKIRLKSRKG